MPITSSERLKQLPKFLFVQIDQLKSDAVKKNIDVIDLGVGDPDIPTPQPIIDALKEAVQDSKYHRYPSHLGMPSFREAAANYYQKHWNVSLDPNNEVLGLIGAKEGIANLPVSLVNPDDIVLVPDPSYPVYGSSTLLNGGHVHHVPLTRHNGFLPDLSSIPNDICRRAKILWLNYPNNPTGAIAPLSFYEDAVAWAKKHDVVLASDAAYIDLYYGEKPPSLLSAQGAKDVSIEFYSLSKTFNMAGWRIAFACGNAELISMLATVKTNVDSGPFDAVQQAAIAGLTGDNSMVENIRDVYRERRDILCQGLVDAGFDLFYPDAGLYCYVAVPQGVTSMEFTRQILEQAHIVTTPGNGFGSQGEGFVRFSLCETKERLIQAIERLKNVKL